MFIRLSIELRRRQHHYLATNHSVSRNCMNNPCPSQGLKMVRFDKTWPNWASLDEIPTNPKTVRPWKQAHPPLTALSVRAGQASTLDSRRTWDHCGETRAHPACWPCSPWPCAAQRTCCACTGCAQMSSGASGSCSKWTASANRHVPWNGSRRCDKQ